MEKPFANADAASSDDKASPSAISLSGKKITAQKRQGPELVFGLIGALGSEINQAERSLRNILKVVGYRVPKTIKLSDILSEIVGSPFEDLLVDNKRAHVAKYMDAGNELRRKTKRGEAVALLSLNAIQRARREELDVTGSNFAAPGSAFIINSLKHPQEVRALRQVYGPAFIAVAIYTQRSRRIQATQTRLRSSYESRPTKAIEVEAEELVDRDEDEQNEPFGQHVSAAFAVADVVVGNSAPHNIKEDMTRFVELLFGDWTHTPRRDEVGMYHAQGSRYRSASMARQVGAVISRPDGSIVSTGMNDVPRAGGGLYDDSDRADGRDHAIAEQQDASDRYKREVLLDLIQNLQEADIGLKFEPKLDSVPVADPKAGIVHEVDPNAEPMHDHPNREVFRDLVSNAEPARVVDPKVELVRIVDSLIENKALKNAKLMSTIDYVRAVHAEMAALMDAARHGSAVANCTMFTTTFPCHDCTKHIVASGIKRVVFVEPYTKSLTSSLFTDSVRIDDPADCGYVHFDPFVGVLPRRYADLFAMHEDRKDVHGMFIEWKAEDALPQLGDYSGPPDARIAVERAEASQYDKLLTEKNIVFRKATKENENGK